MKALILAAGQGTRLRPLTDSKPKCLVELGGKSLLQHQVDVMRRVGLPEPTVIAGYRADQIEALGLPTLINSKYETTNMVSTLMCAASLLDGSDDVLVAYGDIVYEPRVLEAIMTCPDSLSTTVDRLWLRLWQLRAEDPLEDAETMKIDSDGHITELGKKPRSLDDIQGQYMGLIKVRADLAPRLVAIHRALDSGATYDGKDLPNMFMTSFLQHLIDHGCPLRAVFVDGGWLEVDTTTDLARFNAMRAEGTLGEYYQFD